MIDHAQHPAYSDPGRHAPLLDVVPTDPPGLSAVARNLIVHYRASGHELPVATRDEIHSRWLEEILAADQHRHPEDLGAERDVTDRVQGCCRDHTLFCVGALRARGVPARSRVGFAGYFVDGWHHDHVIVEAWLDGRWRRFDAEVAEPASALPDPMDIAPEEATGSGVATPAGGSGREKVTHWVGFRSCDRCSASPTRSMRSPPASLPGASSSSARPTC